MANRVHRVTMFKLPNKDHQDKLLAAYRTLSAEQKKDGAPYILSLVVGPALADPRSKGYTIVAKTEFASLADMRWYDDECPAHAKLKALVPEFGLNPPEDVMSIYFEPGHVAVL
ncbi:Fusaristatin A biosynthesis cluster protein like [Verticillium longisporum]|nr:Fusaristatin A biosynthesis cluster protein like [Verticillium longisporum]